MAAAVAAGAVRDRTGHDREARIVALCWVGLPVAVVTLAGLVRPVCVDR